MSEFIPHIRLEILRGQAFLIDNSVPHDGVGIKLVSWHHRDPNVAAVVNEAKERSQVEGILAFDFVDYDHMNKAVEAIRATRQRESSVENEFLVYISEQTNPNG